MIFSQLWYLAMMVFFHGSDPSMQQTNSLLTALMKVVLKTYLYSPAKRPKLKST